jgi:dienelactone hydrolase
VVGLTPPLGVAYAHEFARRGMVALAPDNAGMGERDAGSPVGGCFLVWARLNGMGLDLTGFRIFELMAGVNLLARHPGVEASRIGCAGLSGGCWLSQVLAALDRRITAVILSGFFTTFTQTTWHGHCICHHPFGIGLLCDLPDIAALIAPRPLFVESGIDDTSYPHEPAYTLTQRAYALQGVEDRLRLYRYPGGHMFNGEESIPWMIEQLHAGCTAG